MSEPGDMTTGPWSYGDSFKSARAAAYAKPSAPDPLAGRGYDSADTDAKTPKTSKTTHSIKIKKPDVYALPQKLICESKNPLTIAFDVTGSMQQWPSKLFEKLPYLWHEATSEYLGANACISFAAFDDIYVTSERALQVTEFKAAKDLDESLKSIQLTGNGGGTEEESAELIAAYYLKNVEYTANTLGKPIFIIITDEKAYPSISPATASKYGINLQNAITTKELFKELQDKYEVYLILKPNSYIHDKVLAFWKDILSEQRIAVLDDANRIADVIFGILAAITGREDYFKHELEDRQLKDSGGDIKVATVYKALETIHAGTRVKTGKSVMVVPKGSKKGKSLV